MSINLSEPAKNESFLQERLKKAVMDEINRQGLNNSQIAEKLGLLPSGAVLLLKRDFWSLETGLRVAEALNLEVKVDVRPRKNE